MIGFPLQLPIDNMAPREITLAEVNFTTANRTLPVLMRNHQFELRIEVTPQEAAALRIWMEALFAKYRQDNAETKAEVEF